MEERHKNWSRELLKSFILKSTSNKKQPNLLHWTAQSKWTLSSFHIVEKYCVYLIKVFWKSFTWKDVYILSPIVTINTRLRVFQCKQLNNAIYLNKNLYIFKLSDTKLCSLAIRKMKLFFICLLTVLKVKHYGIAWNSFLKTPLT